MNIPKAIEIKEAYLRGEAVEHYEHLEADRLSVEALKREQRHRDLELTGIKVLLPGETED